MKKTVFILVSIVTIVYVSYYFYTNRSHELDSDTIILGQSCALSGPAKNLGENMKKGANAYFQHINKGGGVHSRKISLISYDDSYEPLYALKNTQKLLNEDNIFALFGEVGTPTSLAVTPLSKKKNIPFLTPFTGAEFLRNPFEKTFINLRASYYMETNALVEYLVRQDITKISVLYQNDGYGKAGYNGVIKALNSRGITLSSEGRYRRNTLSYIHAFNLIKTTFPQAVIIIGAYKPSAEFIKYAKLHGMQDTKFCNISFVGSKSLIEALGSQTNNVIISQVVPLPWDDKHIAVQEYQEIFKHYYPDDSFGFVSLEGFLSAKLVVKALQLAGENLTRDSFIEAFERLNSTALDGFNITLNAHDHQALDNVYITEYSNNQFKVLKEIHNAK